MYEEMEGMENQDAVAPAEASTETEKSRNGNSTDENTPSQPVENSEAPAPEPALDPANDPSALEADRTDLAKLREEVRSLRKALAEKEEAATRMREECDELWALYPGLSADSLPDDVWDAVRRGVPIAAAVALSERKRFLIAKKAEEISSENRMRSSGACERVKNDYFSPDEVRAMDASEVRKNYQSILKSMQKWK